MTKITKREFLSEVSKKSKLRKDVVEDVFEAITDLITEEIVNKGEFVMKDIFSITNKSWKAYSPLPGIEVKEQRRLSVKLSQKIKKLWKMKNEHYPEVKSLSKDELEKALKYHEEIKLKESKNNPESPLKRKSTRSLSKPSNAASSPKFNFPKNSTNPFKKSEAPTLQKSESSFSSDDFNPLLDEDD